MIYFICFLIKLYFICFPAPDAPPAPAPAPDAPPAPAPAPAIDFSELVERLEKVEANQDRQENLLEQVLQNQTVVLQNQTVIMEILRSLQEVSRCPPSPSNSKDIIVYNEDSPEESGAEENKRIRSRYLFT